MKIQNLSYQAPVAVRRFEGTSDNSQFDHELDRFKKSIEGQDSAELGPVILGGLVGTPAGAFVGASLMTDGTLGFMLGGLAGLAGGIAVGMMLSR